MKVFIMNDRISMKKVGIILLFDSNSKLRFLVMFLSM